MAELGLEDLLFQGRRRDVKDEKIENLFMDSLGINQMFSGSHRIFKFRTEHTQSKAIEILKEFCCDPDIIKKRQECLGYLIESEEFEEIMSNIERVIELYNWLDRVEVYSEWGHTGYNRRVDPNSLNSYFEAISSIMSAFENISDLAKGSHFEELGVLVKQIKESNKFQNLKVKFPRMDYPNSNEPFWELQEENESLYHDLREQTYNFHHLIITLDYFLGYAATFRKFKAQGESVVFPEHARRGGYRYCDIKGAVNPLLYMGKNKEKEKVPINIYSDELHPIRIITAENKYGKTMVLKTRGICQAFFQASLPLLAESAELTTVDKILANIALTEDTMEGESTYQKINETTFRMLQLATSKSLLLLDEPTSGTYDLKALTQAGLYLEGMAFGGYEAWVVTHHLQLAELAERLPQIENFTIEVRDGKQTYRLIPGVFVPTEETMVLDFSAEAVGHAIQGDYHARLQRLNQQGKIPAGQRDQLMGILGAN